MRSDPTLSGKVPPKQITDYSIDLSKIGTFLGWPHEALIIGGYVNFRHSRHMFGRIVDIVEEYPDNHPRNHLARTHKVLLIRLDNGTFITERPEYLDPAKPPELKLVEQ